MYSVFGLLNGFASFWLVVAAFQTSEEALTARPYAIAGALLFGTLAAALFWLGRRLQTPGRPEHS